MQISLMRCRVRPSAAKSRARIDIYDKPLISPDRTDSHDSVVLKER
jgi:hypothetical protein